MPSTAYWTQNDLEPEIRTTGLRNADLTAIDLTGATSVSCLMRRTGQTGAPTVNRTVTISDASNGVVYMDWQTGDLGSVGIYDQNWRIDWGSSRYQTVPNRGYNSVVVQDDLTSG